MTLIFWFAAGAALTLSIAAAIIDQRKGLIPNALTLPGLTLGLLLGLFAGGGRGLLFAAAAGLGSALVPLLLFRKGAMGGGDVKLFAALGALLGAPAALEIQMLAFAVGAAQGIVLWIRRGQLKLGLFSVLALIFSPFKRKLETRASALLVRRTELRFGPAIGAATFAVIVWRIGW